MFRVEALCNHLENTRRRWHHCCNIEHRSALESCTVKLLLTVIRPYLIPNISLGDLLRSLWYSPQVGSSSELRFILAIASSKSSYRRAVTFFVVAADVVAAQHTWKHSPLSSIGLRMVAQCPWLLCEENKGKSLCFAVWGRPGSRFHFLLNMYKINLIYKMHTVCVWEYTSN